MFSPVFPCCYPQGASALVSPPVRALTCTGTGGGYFTTKDIKS